MESGEANTNGTFSTLFARNVPHILEKIFLSLDNKSFEACTKVNKTWKESLSSAQYQKKLGEIKIEKKKNGAKLCYASRYGSTEEVDSILSNLLVDVNCQEGLDQTTPLIEAAKACKNGVVKILQDRGADINKADNRKRTPLHWAALTGRYSVISFLLDAGAEVDKADFEGNTPLHWAAFHGQKDVVRVLLKKGSNPDKKDRNGNTPLHHAVYWNHEHVVKELLDRGADPELNNKLGETYTTLRVAERLKSNGLIKLLLYEKARKD